MKEELKSFDSDNPETEEQKILIELVKKLGDVTQEFSDNLHKKYESDFVVNLLVLATIGFTSYTIEGVLKCISNKDDINGLIKHSMRIFDQYMVDLMQKYSK
jgi:hypothetical protein